MPRKSQSEVYDLSVTYEGQTEKAYKVTPEGMKKAKWVPKSVCELEPDYPKVGATATLTVESWFAENAGLV